MDSLINNLSEFGVLGIFAGLLVFGLVAVFKMLIAQVEKRLEQTQTDLNLERQARVELQKRFDEYVGRDRDEIKNALHRASDVIDESNKIIAKAIAKIP